jgi:predicted ATPase
MNEQFLVEMQLNRARVPAFDTYPFSLNAVKHLEILPVHQAVTFIIGENGSGKSTLLEALAVAWGFNAEGGSQNFNFKSKASHSPLYDYVKLSRGYRKPRNGYFLRAESFYNVASEIEALDEQPGGARIIDSYGGVSLHAQSHGESFLALLMNRFSGDGFYVLDEPEAARRGIYTGHLYVWFQQRVGRFCGCRFNDSEYGHGNPRFSHLPRKTQLSGGFETNDGDGQPRLRHSPAADAGCAWPDGAHSNGRSHLVERDDRHRRK